MSICKGIIPSIAAMAKTILNDSRLIAGAKVFRVVNSVDPRKSLGYQSCLIPFNQSIGVILYLEYPLTTNCH